MASERVRAVARKQSLDGLDMGSDLFRDPPLSRLIVFIRPTAQRSSIVQEPRIAWIECLPAEKVHWLPGD
jgi:hypothetical protein